MYVSLVTCCMLTDLQLPHRLSKLFDSIIMKGLKSMCGTLKRVVLFFEAV